MRSRKSHTISSREVHEWTLNWLVQARLLKDHGWLCKATVVWNIVLRAAARMTSIYAACRDLADAPSEQALLNALTDGLPKTLPVLESRLHWALTGHLPRSLRQPQWQVALDWHLVPYLWPASEESQRTVLRSAAAGDEQVSRLCHGLHCAIRTALHDCSDMGSASRNDRESAGAIAGANPQDRPENQAFAARSGVLQRAGRRVLASRADAVSDACGVSRTPSEEKAEGDRLALDQEATGGLVLAYAQKRQEAGNAFGLRDLPQEPQGPGRQTEATEVVVCRLARDRTTDRNPQALSPTVWHRIQLPADATSADLHLHARSTPAIAVCGSGPDSTQPVGLDPCNDAGRGARRATDAASVDAAIQADVGVDRPYGRRPTSRRFNTLRRFD